MKVISNKGTIQYTRGIQGQDFIGSVRTIVSPEDLNDEHILLIDTFFAWNTLTVQATSEPVEVFVTVSDPAKLDSALWIPLAESLGCPQSYITSGNVAENSSMLYAYEHPLTAFKFRSGARYRVEMCCKSPA